MIISTRAGQLCPSPLRNKNVGYKDSTVGRAQKTVAETTVEKKPQKIQAIKDFSARRGYHLWSDDTTACLGVRSLFQKYSPFLLKSKLNSLRACGPVGPRWDNKKNTEYPFIPSVRQMEFKTEHTSLRIREIIYRITLINISINYRSQPKTSWMDPNQSREVLFRFHKLW